MKNTNLVEFEEDIWSTENSVDVLPYILVCKGGLETYIAANDSNTIFVPSQATCICSCAFDAGTAPSSIDTVNNRISMERDSFASNLLFI